MPLTGDELKAKVEELKPAPEAEIAIACGYVSDSGKARMAAFKDALLDAHGLSLKPAKPAGRKGRALSFSVAASTKGAIVLASGYAALIGIGPGEQAAIAHHDHQLIITKAGLTPTATPIAALDLPPLTPPPPVVTYDTAPAATAEPQPTVCPF